MCRIIGCAGTIVLAATVAFGVNPLRASCTPIGVVRVKAPVAKARLGADSVSLESSSSAIDAGDTFGYSARVRLKAPAESVTVRIRLSRPTGRLIYQRTRTFADDDAKVVTTAFERGTDDLDLRPGIYPVELEVSILRDGRSRTTTVNSKLFVRTGDQSVPVALVARIGGPPLSDPAGRFVADPATYTRARDDANTVATWVVQNPTARATLAISPLLLEEWRRISEGYELAGPEGTVQVLATDAVPHGYASTLDLLAEALRTGRLELTAQGYSDPDLSALHWAGLLDDVTQQYEHGLSAVYTSLEATASTGTIPATGCVPDATVPLLTNAGVGYAVVDASQARVGKKRAAPSSYRVGTKGFVVLVPDDTLTDAVASGDTSAAIAHAFNRLIDDTVDGPMLISAELGAGGMDAAKLLKNYETLTADSWIRPCLARDVAFAPKKRSVKLRPGNGIENDPDTYWQEVREGREWSDALIAAVGESTPEAVTAHRDSMIAECSAWAGTDGSWALEDRGRTFAARAKRLSTDIFGKVTLVIEPVTLAGTEGNVPVTIRNASGRTLRLHLSTTSGPGVRIASKRQRGIDLGPKETFVEIPVVLGNVISGDLRVSLLAGNSVIDTVSVTVKASYLDRIALIAGVIALMVGLLVYIIRHVSRAEEQSASAAGTGRQRRVSDDGATEQDTSPVDEAYTGQTSFDSLWRDR